MDLHQLRALLLVAETGSVTAASRRLFLTQPAVTRQIRALEDELGGGLFDRTTKPLTPTPLGRTALDEARRILQLTEEFRARISSHAGALQGELKMGASYSLGRRLIPPVVLALRRRHPGLQVLLTTGWGGAIKRAVEEGSLDAGVVMLPPHAHFPVGVTAVRVAHDPAVLVAPRSMPLRGRVRLEALRGTGWVLNPEGCGYRAKLKRALEEAGVPFRVVVEAPDLGLQLDLIRAGVGAGIFSRRALPPRLEEAGLRTFAIQGISFSFEAWLLHRRTGPIVPVVMPLVEQVVAAVFKGAGRGVAPPRTLRTGGPAHPAPPKAQDDEPAGRGKLGVRSPTGA
jgi:DNA-binding transcriptional LysR family regulator